MYYYYYYRFCIVQIGFCGASSILVVMAHPWGATFETDFQTTSCFLAGTDWNIKTYCNDVALSQCRDSNLSLCLDMLVHCMYECIYLCLSVCERVVWFLFFLRHGAPRDSYFSREIQKLHFYFLADFFFFILRLKGILANFAIFSKNSLKILF